MRIYICDDNELDAGRVRRMAAKYASRFGCALTAETFPSAQKLLTALEDGAASPDLIFMDVYMNGMDGVEALRRLRSPGLTPRPIPVIFSTSSESHAIEAFRLHAVGYLHKPYTQEDFDHAMSRVEQFFAAGGRTLRVWPPEQEYAQEVYLEDVLYIETSGRGTLLHIGGRSARTGICARMYAANRMTGAPVAVPSRLPMQEYREKLAGERDFCQCGRSYLVNLNHAAEIVKYGLQMDCGDTVPVPERLRSDIVQRLENWRQYVRNLSL